MARPKKQFCKYGHDTYIYGRTKKGQCRECKRTQECNRQRRIRSRVPKKKSGRSKVQFCPKGHDVFVVGRNKSSRCIDCANESSKKRYKRIKSKEIILAPQPQFCIHGHDTFIYGRCTLTNRCKRCRNISSDKNKMLRKFNVVAWTDWTNIYNIYNNRPKDNHVDHYIPLRGKKVYGLHVSWNLQYLVSQLNQEKTNKCNLLEASEWYGKILEQAGLK